MYRQYSRNLQLLKSGLAGQGTLSAGQIRFKATTPPAPPRPPRADLQSIPGALRELLPPPRQRDPNAPPRRGRRPLFYIALISPLFIWIALERYFDPKPRLEKKRKRLLRERIERLREHSRGKPQFTDTRSVLAYVRLILDTMLPEEYRRNMKWDDVYALLAEECPNDLLRWLQELCPIIYELSLQSENEEGEMKVAERIQESADDILRKCFLAVHRRFPPGSVTRAS
ncbi:hypothetical protein DFH07DRAFT_958507 [Mycena maculata]|uniref:Uncharacterized protein n=1 Tax=Mycena maculata TaxID=230809 RepID=A0AAD7J949_9AGAR|nr:hypothetical protein DFH07DRAFT_958507 [Mycena maculata]